MAPTPVYRDPTTPRMAGVWLTNWSVAVWELTLNPDGSCGHVRVDDDVRSAASECRGTWKYDAASQTLEVRERDGRGVEYHYRLLFDRHFDSATLSFPGTDRTQSMKISRKKNAEPVR